MRIKPFALAVLAALVAVVSGGARAETLFESGAKWLYYKGNDHPSGGDLEWAEPDFDDSDWPSGDTPIRYGDGNGGTVLADMRNRYSTVFFRRTFTVGKAAEVAELELLVNYDDGFVVWINGEEVLDVGGSADLTHDSFASLSHESGNFETFALANPAQYLVDGKNLIAVMGFNINLTSSDFMMDAELRSYRPDTSPPTVGSIDPPPGNVSLLREVTIRFDEEVTGVDADDLWLNGDPAVELRGSKTKWTFTFASGDFGEAMLSWNPAHGIADTARPPNPMDGATAAATHRYRIVDDMPPTMANVLPPPGSTVRGLSRVRLFFSEPIRGLEAADLRVNGQAPTSIAGVAGGPWQIEFPPADNGLVTIAWVADHGVTDMAAEPNRLAADGWHYNVDAKHDFGQVVINELLAANRDGLKDEEGETGDWIELRNVGNASVNLAGWSLSDDPVKPGKWVFPAVALPPSATLVVHATGKNRSASRQALHTNFKLGVEGEYLGLFSPELPRRVADEISPVYPEQRGDISYGRLANGEWAWFETPTPGTGNRGKTIQGLLAPPKFSAERGVYDAQFRVHLTTEEPGAVIRYTTDYSEPTATRGKIYSAPIPVRRTTVVRAAVFKSGMLPSRVMTHTYAYNLSKGVTSLPMMSLVTENSNLRGNTGIMETNPRNTTKRGIAWERPVSMELIYPETGETLQANAGLRVQGGNYIRGRYNPNSGPPAGKYSFRLYFRGDYGPGRLRYPFFPGLQVQDFNHIVLRAGMNDHSNPFVVDELVRRLSADMGQVSARGTFMNLYLNGKNNGYYNPTERIDSDFLNSWNGSDSEWDIIAQFGELREGDTVKWNELKSALLKNLSVPQNYAAAERLLNVDNFIDYIMLNVYANTGDWPHNNWRAARQRVPGAKWRFIVWDAEWAFGNNGRSVTGNNLTSGPLAGDSDIARFYRSLQKNPEFRMRFADRVQIHYFNGGALTDENVLRRFLEMKEELSGVIRNMNMTVERTWVPRRRAIVMSQMATQKIQASDNAPQFAQDGGAVPAGYRLKLTAPEGEIYYTLNGTDPRRPGEMAEVGKTILAGDAEKWALVPSADNGGNALGNRWRGGSEPFDHDDWDSGNDGVGYDQNADYDSHIGLDVDAEMNDINQSVFVRIPFRVSAADRKKSNFMVLSMKYDDGFVAYLNGTRIASANAALNPAWNAGATGQHDDASAVTWVSFDAGKYINKLKTGNNILAIHGLNSGLGSSDMLINAELSLGQRTGAEIAEGVLKYNAPLRISGDTTIRARTMHNGQWSALVEHSFQAGRAGSPLRFTEIMYNPPGGSEYEFVELHNSGTFEVSLGWHRFDGIDFTFPGDAVIGPGEYLVLASDNDPDAFKLRYPGLAVHGWYQGSLSNNGERLALLDLRWRRVVEVDYSDRGAWPSAADGEGRSLELIDLLGDPGAASNWRGSTVEAGSPGEAGSAADSPTVIINEVHVQSPLSAEPDFVELRNLGQAVVDLSGWTLHDSDNNTFEFPAGTALGQAGLLGIWCGEGEGAGLRAGFGLGQAGDSVALFNADG
ncbi:MAG: lamin tail domain-containing protein, partial [Verrucomicrobiota bacterium]|nr:lamin tail domain-containing protein [Verrucomicrobiota bacterium]